TLLGRPLADAGLSRLTLIAGPTPVLYISSVKGAPQAQPMTAAEIARETTPSWLERFWAEVDVSPQLQMPAERKEFIRNWERGVAARLQSSDRFHVTQPVVEALLREFRPLLRTGALDIRGAELFLATVTPPHHNGSTSQYLKSELNRFVA